MRRKLDKNPLDSGEESEPQKGPDFDIAHELSLEDADVFQIKTRDIHISQDDNGKDEEEEYCSDEDAQSEADTEDTDYSDETMLDKIKRRTGFMWRDPVTLAVSHRRIAQSSLSFLLLVFLINALITTVAFWKAGSMSPNHVAFKSVRLTGLDEDRAILDISGELKDTFLMSYVQFKLTKPLETKISVENGSKHQVPLITFTIPAGELVDPQTRKFSVQNIEIVFNETFPMEAFADLLTPEHFIDAELEEILEKLPNFSVNMDFGIATNSFWIPFRFTSIQKMVFNPAKESKALLNSSVSTDLVVPDFKLKGLNFLQDQNSFKASGKLAIPSDVFPEFVYIEVPSLNWELRQKTLEPVDGAVTAAVTNVPVYSASHRMLSFSVPRQTLDGSTTQVSFAFNFSLHEHDRRGIAEALGSFRDAHLNDLVISLAHNSKAVSPCKGLCKWLAPFEINFPVGPFVKALPKNKASIALPFHNSLIDVDFNGVKKGSLAAFSLTISSDLSFLPFEKLIDLTEIFTTPFPEFKTRLLLDNGKKNVETLLTTTFKHVVSSPKVAKVELVLELNNLEDLTRSIMNLVNSVDKQKIFFSGSSDSFLSSLLVDPLAIEIDSSTLKPRFRLGKRLLLSELLHESTALATATVPEINFSETIRHKFNISTESSATNFALKSHLNFADSSNVKLPFIKVSWIEAAISLSPVFGKASSLAELVNFRLEKGNCHIYLAEKNPILLFHDGFLDFKMEMTTSASKQESFLHSWKLFVRNLLVPNAPNFVPVIFAGKSKEASFSTTASLPTASVLLPLANQLYLKSLSSKHEELPECWVNWFKSLAETTVKLAGMRGLTTQLLIELPQMEICMKPLKFDSFAIDLRLEMTGLDLNVCRRNQKSDAFDMNESPEKMDKSGLSNQACLMQVGLQPMVFDVNIVDGSVCGLLTGINSAPLSTKHAEDDEENLIQRNRDLLERTFAEDLSTTSPADIHDPSTRLVNLVPLNISIIDLDGLVQLVLDVSKNSWEGLRMSLGHLSAKKVKELGADFEKTDMLLLNQLTNTIGSLFALSAKDGMVYLLKSGGKRPVPPIEKFNLKDSMSLNLDIKSPNRNLIVGSFALKFPESSLPVQTAINNEEPRPLDVLELPENVPVTIVNLPKASSSFPETVLVNVQWGTIDIRIAHKSSFLELHLPEGCLALRIHKTSGALSMDDSTQNYFSKKIGLDFRLFMDFDHMSSVTLRRMTDRLGLWREDGDVSTDYAERIKEMVQTRSLDMEVQLQPYSKDTFGQTVQVVRSEIPVGILVHLVYQLKSKIEVWGKKAFKTSRHSKYPSALPEITITPDPLQSAVYLPCIVPVLCTKKQMRRSLSKDLRLMKFKIGIRKVVQGVADGIGHLVGILVEKLNFSQHPAKMNLFIKTSAVAFGFAVNGVEALEVEVSPFKIDRQAAIVYSGHKSGFSVADILKFRQRDNFEFHVLTKLSPAVKNLQQILSPVILDPDEGIVLKKTPVYHHKYLDNSAFVQESKKKLKQRLYHVPLVVSLQNESTRYTSLLSSLIAFSIPSIHLGPLQIDAEAAAKHMKKLKIPKPRVTLENSNEVDLTVKISKIVIPNPLPLSLNINHRIGFEIRYEGYTFIRAAIEGKTLQIRANKPAKLTAHLVLSKNAFGKLPAKHATVFRDFLSDLAFGRPVKFEIAIHIGKKHSIHLPVGLDWRAISKAMFNADKVDLDFIRANYFVDSLSTGFMSAFRVGQSVTRGARWLMGYNNDTNTPFEGLPAANDPNRGADLLTEVQTQFQRQAAERKLHEKEKKRSLNKSKNQNLNTTFSSSSDSDSWSTERSDSVDISTSNSSSTSNYSGSTSSTSSTGNSSSSTSESTSHSISSSTSTSSATDSSSSSDKHYKRHKRSFIPDDQSEVDEQELNVNDNVLDHEHEHGNEYELEQELEYELEPEQSPEQDDNLEQDQFADYGQLLTQPSYDFYIDSPTSSPLRRAQSCSIDDYDTSNNNNNIIRQGSPSLSFPMGIGSSSNVSNNFDLQTLSTTEYEQQEDLIDNVDVDVNHESLSKTTKKKEKPGYLSKVLSFFFSARPYDAEIGEGFSSDDSSKDSDTATFATAQEFESLSSVVSNCSDYTFNSATPDNSPLDLDQREEELNFEEVTGFPRANDEIIGIEEHYESFSETSFDGGDNIESSEDSSSDLENIRRRCIDSTMVIAALKTGESPNDPSTSSSSSSTGSSSSSSSTDSSSSEPPAAREDPNPIRRTHENQFVHYKADSSAPRVFEKVPVKNRKNGVVHLKEVDGTNLRKTPFIDTSNIKSKRHKHSSSSNDSDSDNSSNSTGSNDSSSSSTSGSSDSSTSTSSSSDSSSKKHRKHKDKMSNKKKNRHPEQVKIGPSGFFTIQRDLDPAADNPTNSPGLLDQAFFTAANIANHARVRLFFVNPSDFRVYVLGANMRVVIDDLDMLWSMMIGGRIVPHSHVVQEIEARLFLAPQNCRPSNVEGMRSFSKDNFLKCCRENQSKPVEVILPNTETEVSAYIYLKNPMASLQVLDEMLMHDGLCTHVIDSPVSVALEADNGRPFVLELIANILDEPGRPRPFGDPCRLETKCEPKQRKFVPIGEVSRTNRNDAVELYNPSSQLTFFNSATDFGQLWRQKGIDLSADFETSFRLEAHWIYSSLTGLRQETWIPGFGIVFARTRVVGSGKYGLEGLDQSIAIILDPRTHTISLIRNGESRAILSKTNGAFPYDLAAHPVLVTVRHRPHQKKLIITVAPELPDLDDKKPYYFTTVFPVNIGAMLGVLKGAAGDHDIDRKVRYRPAKRVSIGLTGSASNYQQLQFRNWSINSILPDLEKTLIFFDQKSQNLVHRPGRFLVQLQDSCGKVINGLGDRNMRLNVQMKLISSHSKRSNYDIDRVLLDAADLSDEDYSIHDQPDTRPSTKVKSPQKHRSAHHHSHDPTLSNSPKDYWIDNVTIKHIPHYGLYQVDYVPDLAGRYEIYLAIGTGKIGKSSKKSKKCKKSKKKHSSSSSDSDSSSSVSDSTGSSSRSRSSSSSSSRSSSSNASSSDTDSFDSSSGSSDSDSDSGERIGGSKFKPETGFNWTRLNTYNIYIPSLW